jgi:hypothetical protein
LGVYYHLVLVVHRRQAVIPLNYPVTAWHLRAFVVGDIALYRLSRYPDSILMSGKPFADLFRLLLKMFDRFLLLFLSILVSVLCIGGPLPVKQYLHRLLDLLGFLAKLSFRATPLLGTV